MAEPEATQLLRRARELASKASTLDWNEDRNVMSAVHLAGDIDTHLSTTPVEAMRRKTLEEAAALMDERAAAWEAKREAYVRDGNLGPYLGGPSYFDAARAIRALIDPKEADCG